MSSLEETPTDTALTLRPFQNADAKAVTRLVTGSVRGPWTYRAEHFRESDDPQRCRTVALQEGEVIATANFSPFGDGAPDALRLDFAGDGAAFLPLYLRLLAELPVGFTRLLGVACEDFAEKMSLYTAAGFRNASQSWGARPELSTLDSERFRGLEEKLFLQGYEVQRWDNGARAAEYDALYQLHQQGEADAPRNPVTTTAALSRKELRAVMTKEETVFVVRFRGGSPSPA